MGPKWAFYHSTRDMRFPSDVINERTEDEVISRAKEFVQAIQTSDKEPSPRKRTEQRVQIHKDVQKLVLENGADFGGKFVKEFAARTKFETVGWYLDSARSDMDKLTDVVLAATQSMSFKDSCALLESMSKYWSLDHLREFLLTIVAKKHIPLLRGAKDPVSTPEMSWKRLEWNAADIAEVAARMTGLNVMGGNPNEVLQFLTTFACDDLIALAQKQKAGATDKELDLTAGGLPLQIVSSVAIFHLQNKRDVADILKPLFVHMMEALSRLPEFQPRTEKLFQFGVSFVEAIDKATKKISGVSPPGLSSLFADLPSMISTNLNFTPEDESRFQTELINTISKRNSLLGMASKWLR